MPVRYQIELSRRQIDKCKLPSAHMVSLCKWEKGILSFR